MGLLNKSKETFFLVATLIGFVVDSIAIISILSGYLLINPNSKLELSPTVLLLILMICFILYIGFLWLLGLQLSKKIESSETFLDFLVNDFIFSPNFLFFALLPIFVLIMVWVYIVPNGWVAWFFSYPSAETGLGVGWIIGLLYFLLYFFVIYPLHLRFSIRHLTQGNNWMSVKDRLSQELSDKRKVKDVDVSVLFHIPLKSSRKLLRKYYLEDRKDNMKLLSEVDTDSNSNSNNNNKYTLMIVLSNKKSNRKIR